MNPHDEPTPPAVAALVDAMLQSHGQLALIVDSMLRYPSPEDADPIPEVLARLVGGILVQLEERHGADDVATAAQMLAAATQLVGEDLFFVPPADRPGRRARRRRRGH